VRHVSYATLGIILLPVKARLLKLCATTNAHLEHGILALRIRRRVQIYARQASGRMKKDYLLTQNANYVVRVNGALLLVSHRTTIAIIIVVLGNGVLPLVSHQMTLAMALVVLASGVL
jgi:hypothetical protein